MPTISVVIPCYGYAHFLPDAVHSLVGGLTCLGEMPGQTFADFEAIIVDDASHDETPQVASELSKQYDRVRYVRTRAR
jgi:glycosyltransferase involved in cell wall biosynthesis